MPTVTNRMVVPVVALNHQHYTDWVRRQPPSVRQYYEVTRAEKLSGLSQESLAAVIVLEGASERDDWPEIRYLLVARS